MQQRMHADVGAGGEVGLELVPELRRLVAEIPLGVLAARAEHPLLGARRLLVAADAGDHRPQVELGDQPLERLGLARRRARGRRQARVDLLDRRAVALVEVQAPLNRVAILDRRSEEHTSELQSLMRISYAVFCLNKKKYN